MARSPSAWPVPRPPAVRRWPPPAAATAAPARCSSRRSLRRQHRVGRLARGQPAELLGGRFDLRVIAAAGALELLEGGVEGRRGRGRLQRARDEQGGRQRGGDGGAPREKGGAAGVLTSKACH